MKRNIRIAYILTFLQYSWFWIGIWVLFYLKFTDYSGIGILETILIFAIVVSEIPTGAIADMLGKKLTLTVSFFIQACGIFLMSYSQNVFMLGTGIFIAGIGGAFYSGTLEALVYDSIKEENKTKLFDKVISNIGTLTFISPAICGIIGGFLYTQNPTLPLFANGIANVLAFMLCFWLSEPHIDTEKFSLKNYRTQLKQGIFQLFRNESISRQTILLLSIGAVVAIVDEMLDGFLSVEFGFSPAQLGVLWSIVYLFSAAASQLTPGLTKRFEKHALFYTIGILIALSLIISPIIAMIAGGTSIIFRSSFQAIFGNLTSIAINEHTDSKHRATTLSSFSTLRYLPYVILAILIGHFSNVYSAKIVALFLGIIIIIILAVQFLQTKQKKT